MSMSRPGAIPKVPTLPAGDEVAAYPAYLQAQQAVDYLSDNKFPVENVTIVGTDLRMVERVTGRLTYGRVALAGALSGAWFGLFVGLLLTFFAGEAGGGVLFVGIGLGAGFGLLFSVLSYAFTGGRRDFTSSSQIVAATYAILCASEHASEARAMLMQSPSGVGRPSGSAIPHTGHGMYDGGAGAQAGRPYGGGQSPAGPGAAEGGPTAGGSGAGTPAGAGTPEGAGTLAGAGTLEGADDRSATDTPAPRPSRPDPRFVTPDGKPRYGAMRPDATPATPEPAAPNPPAAAPPAPNPPAADHAAGDHAADDRPTGDRPTNPAEADKPDARSSDE